MTEETTKPRRSRGERSVWFDESRNRWIAEATVGYSGSGKRIRRKGSGTSKSAALAALKERIDDYKKGLGPNAEKYTVANAISDWLEYGHGDVDVDTFKRHDYLSQHVVKALGARKLRDLRTREVEAFLKTLAPTHATRTIRDIKWCLNIAVRRAMARDLIDRNVVDLAEVPRGLPGRPSKSLTKEQAIGVVTLTKAHWIYPYIVVSLLTGVRTEETRALLWEDVDLDSTPATITVLRSVRKTGDTKTQKSRRGLAIGELVVDVLRRHRDAQERLRADAGAAWTETGLVFTTKAGTGLDAANVRRALRSALRLVPGIVPGDWAPRELRHSFTSIMSEEKVPLEEIARVLGHSGTAVTEKVYRHELRPVIETGATVMDRVFTVQDVGPGWHMQPLFGVQDAEGPKGA
ncbi:tyrosine recombinase XerC [Promicromonospora thailandica]|uniref:Site-specific recombinase XerD n=1 Tax=Promicromonospora thailandica TaxID=765201 RepID=A0A9X2GD66_9MICO|nr:site-specific integrase [Promicromonospora thailandica]MCP2266406.1 Site-specific recombinase XerD [Promicromonospora thailandica]BFF20086.1 site-specific integrase [Promicromonospora thailandica]